ncbi:MAG: DUF4352 domain-containing protein, partial [Luteimonas sp.]
GDAVAAAAALLSAACLLTGCDRAKQAVAILGPGADHAAPTAPPLVPVVHATQVTHALDTSTLEHREASPGNTFVVLDVTVRNADAHPQVFSEGRLVSVDARAQRSFATPVTLLAGEFLSLQVLQPASSVRGKIAYEVPSNLHGALYWQPGAGGPRILLHPEAPTTVSTLGNAPGNDVASLPAPVPPTSPAVINAAVDRAAKTADSAPGRPPSNPAARDAASARPDAVAQAPSPARAAAATPPDVSRTNQQARALACQALLARNDPAEKSRYLGFFAHECADYAMPSNWRPGVASVPVRPSSPRRTTVPAPASGPAFDCSRAWTGAEHLVCADAVLSLMDRQLNRAYAEARKRVADPLALQREEDDWRHRVRDACDSIPCIERAYDQRTAELDAAGRVPR